MSRSAAVVSSFVIRCLHLNPTDPWCHVVNANSVCVRRVSRRFPEITGEIIRKSDASAVEHYFSHGLLAYIGPWFQMEAAVEKRWSVTVSDLQAWTYTMLDCQMALCARNTSFFLLLFSAYYGLFGGATCGVRLEWRTDWIDCERSLFTPCSWLRRSL